MDDNKEKLYNKCLNDGNSCGGCRYYTSESSPNEFWGMKELITENFCEGSQYVCPNLDNYTTEEDKCQN